MDIKKLEKIAKLLRYYVLISTTQAGSGHPTSCLSAIELLTTLFFAGFFRQDLENPKAIYNDRFILSKGHAAPILYSIYTVAGVLKKEQLLSLRQFGSILEGHPTPKFNFADVTTGSLGQGLSIGLGMALGIRLKFKNQKIKRLPKIYVLMGDSELAEGQVWEAVQLSSFYHVSNLIALVDINRLGQNGQTMFGWKIDEYQRRFESFGWQVYKLTDGHNLDEIKKIFQKIETDKNNKPEVILAKTVKGKGVDFLENQEGWHGKALNKDQLSQALKQLGNVDSNLKASFKKPERIIFEKKYLDKKIISVIEKLEKLTISKNNDSKKTFSTRESYGRELTKLGEVDAEIVVLDAETGNSTYHNYFKEKFSDRFFQIYIAEQNMVSIGLGLSKLGFKVYLSTFAAFLTRAFDQLRMAGYSDANLKVAGSHAGVSIGQDGASQMGLEDLAMFNSILKTKIFYPSDKTSAEKLTRLANDLDGIVYLRLTRSETPMIYDEKEEFVFGGCKVHYSMTKSTNVKKILIITAGITLFEALKAQEILTKQNYEVIVIDLYSVKPFDEKTLLSLMKKYTNVIVVEDHYSVGGLGSIIEKFILEKNIQVKNYLHLACKKIPMSGKPEELLNYEEIDYKSIVDKVKKIV